MKDTGTRLLYRYGFIGLILFITILSSTVDAAKNDIVNKQVTRNIDLTNQLATHSIDLSIENTGDATDYYNFVVSNEFEKKLSFIEVGVGSEDNRKKLETKKQESDRTGDYVVYKVNLGQKLDKGGKIENLHIELVFIHTMVPFPEEITQSERQLVKYTDNHYYYSVYKTDSVKTKVKLSSTSVQYNSELQPFSIKGDVVSYGPYKDIAPLSQSPLSLHFENNKPFITVNHVQRLVEVSNWGNVAVEEQYKISHDGAKLKGSFSRYDFQINAQANGQVAAVQFLELNLPETATDVYYRDDIGNISTSALRPSKPKQRLELRPRFPMFGGWKTEFTVGYNIPTYSYLSTDYNTGKFILRVPFIADWEWGVAIDSQVLKVILPEGSSDISVKAPFDVEIRHDSTITYLDSKSFGRPTVLITKNNLNNIHNQYIEIWYSFNSLFLFWEPILLIGSYFSLFLLVIACLRVELSIEESKSTHSDEKTLSILDHISEIYSTREELHTKLEEDFSKFLKDSDSKTFEAERKSAITRFQNYKSSVSDDIGKLQSIHPDLASKLSELEKKQADKEKVQAQLIDLQYRYKFKKSNITADAYDQEKTTLLEKYEGLTSDVETEREDLLEN